MKCWVFIYVVYLLYLVGLYGVDYENFYKFAFIVSRPICSFGVDYEHFIIYIFHCSLVAGMVLYVEYMGFVNSIIMVIMYLLFSDCRWANLKGWLQGLLICILYYD